MPADIERLALGRLDGTRYSLIWRRAQRTAGPCVTSQAAECGKAARR